jgi:hypothetical protein
MLCYNQFEEHRGGRERIASFKQATSVMERSFRKQGAGCSQMVLDANAWQTSSFSLPTCWMLQGRAGVMEA